MAPPVAPPDIVSVPPGIVLSSPGVHPANTQGPCSGPCYAGGPGPRHSGTDVCPSPWYNRSGTAPPVPFSSSPTSDGPDTIVSLAAWNAAPCTRVPPSPSLSRCSPPSVPPAPGCPRLDPPPPSAPPPAAFVWSPWPPSPWSLHPPRRWYFILQRLLKTGQIYLASMHKCTKITPEPTSKRLGHMELFF